MLQPPSASVFLAFSGAPMPIKIGDKLKEMKYVQAVAPVLLQFSASGGVDLIYGIDPESFREVSNGFVFLQGHDMQGPDDMLVDDWAAKAKHITVGGTFHVLGQDRSEEHTSELQSRLHLVCRLLLEKKKKRYVVSTH